MQSVGSHSIQKAGSLESIAERQHVMTPSIDLEGSRKMTLIGVRKASVFPGFCERHERTFASFEGRGTISFAREASLQTFRTLCCEIARKRHDVSLLEEIVLLNKEARVRFHQERLKAVDPTAKVIYVTADGDWVDERLAYLVSDGKATLHELEFELYPEFWTFIQKGRPQPYGIGIRIPMEVPVCLSGLGPLRYLNKEGREVRALCLLAVLPEKGATFLIISAARRHSVAVNRYAARLGSGFGALNAIESWMTNGSDHWFIRPSVWQSLPTERQQRILDAISDDGYPINANPTVSIFDGIRRDLIVEIERNPRKEGNSERLVEALRIEKAKVA